MMPGFDFVTRSADADRAAGRMRKALAGWTGLLIHRIIDRLREAVFATAHPAPENIAVFCDAFLRYGCAQAAGLGETGANVTLYYVDRLDEFAGNADDRARALSRARDADVHLVALPRRSMRTLLQQVLWLHRDLRRRQVAVAVVHAHIDPRYATLGLALPVALLVHDPQVHSGDESSTFSFPVRLASRIVELTSSCLMVHSVPLLEQLAPLLSRMPVCVVPHGTDMSPAPIPVPEKRQLLVFGRLFEYKGVDTALEAFASLPRDMSDANLVVAGRGPLAPLGRGRRNIDVREGYITDSDLDELLGDTRLVLLAYKDATQSGVGLQAIARGIPCLVSRAGGLPELVDGASPGLVVPPDRPEQLTAAIIAHIDHDETLRRAIYDHAAANFAWAVVTRRMRSELGRLGVAEYAINSNGTAEARGEV